MLKDYAENCSWKSRYSRNHFGVNPTAPSYCQAPRSLLWALGPSQSCISLGREGAFLRLCLMSGVLHQSGPQQAVWDGGSWVSHAIKTCVWTGLSGIKPAGAEAEILHSLECLGEPEKGWGQLYLVRVSWQLVSHRSLPHKHFLPVFVSLHTNVLLIAIAAVLTQCSC